MAFPTLHARAEAKPFEHRSCLTPTTAKKLLDAGYPVLVERSPKDPNFSRIFVRIVHVKTTRETHADLANA